MGKTLNLKTNPDGAYNELDVHDFKSERTADILIHIQALRDNGAGIYQIDESNGLNLLDGLDHTYMHCRVWSDDIGTTKTTCLMKTQVL